MPEYEFALKDRKVVAEGTMAFFFDISGSDFHFKAGQFAEFILPNPKETDGEGNKRLFSIASSPEHDDYLMITTRMRATAFKNNLKSMPLGEKVRIRGPMGVFTLHSDLQKPAVFLAGGIGITPFRSIIEFATSTELPCRIYLLYSNRTKESTAFFEEFEEWKEKNKNFIFIPTITDSIPSGWKYETGRITAEMIKKSVGPDLKKAIFYICGPPAMVSALNDVLKELEINEDNIKSEEFAGY